MTKAILFDFFGVIREDGFQKWMDNHGFTRDDAPGVSSRRLDTGMINPEEFMVELGEASGQTKEQVKHELENDNKFNRELISYIKELRETYRVGLLSNADADYLNGELRREELVGLFDSIVISSDTGFAKPDKEIFDLALEGLGVSAGETIFIDDNTGHVNAAKRIGLQAIQFQTNEMLKNDLSEIL